MNKSRLSCAAAVVLLVVLQDRSTAQLAAPVTRSEQCSFSEVYQQAGWTIPGLAGAVPKERRYAVWMKIDGIEDPRRTGVFVTTLRAGTPHSRLTVLRCSNDVSGRLIARLIPVKVIEMWRFDFKGKVFAYGVDYEAELNGPGGLRASLEDVPVVFYDSDGTGRFTLLKYMHGSIFRWLEIPEWAKKSTP